jgi:ATP-binding cassette subfamily B multidrug efflux pump
LPPFRASARRAPVSAAIASKRKIFGKAYDPKTVRRIWAFVRPYRTKIYLSVAAVLVFTATQLAIPLVIGRAIDSGMTEGGNSTNLLWAVGMFAVAVLFNFGASYVQETEVGKVAENVLFDMRRAMFAQLQRVSLSFMDKTEVGRLMSRLQGDVNSMQEFLETSVISVGDMVLLVGIVVVLLTLDFRLGLLTLSTMPILFIVRIFWLPPAKRAFWRRMRPIRSPQAPWPRVSMACAPCRISIARRSISTSMTTRPITTC